MVASVATTEAGVKRAPSKVHSRSWRGRPVHAQTRCFIATCRVVLGSPSLKLGSTSVTGVSQVSLPASTSLASISVVRALVFEAIMNSVSAFTRSGLPSSRTPKPSARTTSPSCTMPMASRAPGLAALGGDPQRRSDEEILAQVARRRKLVSSGWMRRLLRHDARIISGARGGAGAARGRSGDDGDGGGDGGGDPAAGADGAGIPRRRDGAGATAAGAGAEHGAGRGAAGAGLAGGADGGGVLPAWARRAL